MVPRTAVSNIKYHYLHPKGLHVSVPVLASCSRKAASTPYFLVQKLMHVLGGIAVSSKPQCACLLRQNVEDIVGF